MMWFGNRGDNFQDMPCFGNWAGLGGGRFFMIIGGLVLLALLITVIVLIVKSVSKNQAVSSPGLPGSYNQNNISGTEAEAMNILNNRFARGEIDETEYERRKKLIMSK